MNVHDRTATQQAWITFLIAVVVFLSIVSCAGPGRFFEKPRISIAKIRIEHMGVPDQVFRVDVKVANPNNVSLTITGAEGTLDIDGRTFARGISTVTTQIPARGEAIIPVSLTASLSDIIMVMKKYLKGKKGVTYAIKGNLYTAKSIWLPSAIPFSSEGTLSPRGANGHDGGERSGR